MAQAEPPGCLETLTACNKALSITEQALEDERAIARELEAYIEEQSSRIGELEAEADSFWGSPLPWAVMSLGVGFAIGGAL